MCISWIIGEDKNNQTIRDSDDICQDSELRDV